MKISLFSHITPRSPLKVNRRFLLGLFFDPDEEGDMFLRNVLWLSTDYTPLYLGS
jgi:hypothetical protein